MPMHKATKLADVKKHLDALNEHMDSENAESMRNSIEKLSEYDYSEADSELLQSMFQHLVTALAGSRNFMASEEEEIQEHGRVSKEKTYKLIGQLVEQHGVDDFIQTMEILLDILGERGRPRR